jgi:hypothetical protein
VSGVAVFGVVTPFIRALAHWGALGGRLSVFLLSPLLHALGHRVLGHGRGFDACFAAFESVVTGLLAVVDVALS